MTIPLIEPADLAAELGEVERLLLVVDFDGTLAPIVDRPGDASALPAAITALRRLCVRTTVAVLSGRTVADLIERLPDLSLIYAGGHGAQIRGTDGQVVDLIDVDTVSRTLDDAEARLTEVVAEGTGWFVERKASSLAVHHRLVPEVEEDDLLPRVRALMEARGADGPGFDVMGGKAVLELRPRGVNKGAALDQIAQRHPHLTPVVFGDDATDEDAFRAATARGGHGILVADTDRGSLASWRLEGPDAVAAVLERLAADGVEG